MENTGGAYGGAKAGGPLDIFDALRRPQTLIRVACMFFGIIVFGSIASSCWVMDKELGKRVCLFNKDNGACNYVTVISVIAFLASLILFSGELIFDQMSSVKTRKHYVLGDLGFSALWTFLYFVGFCYLANAWGKTTEPKDGEGGGSALAAIMFSFFSIFTWGGCAFFAFQRFRIGGDAAFAPSYEIEGALGGGGGYASYPGAPDPDPAYQDPPFTQQRGPGDYQEPTY